MIYIFFIILFLIILFIPLNIKIIFNLNYYQFKVFNINIYKQKYVDIKDIKKERTKIRFLRIFNIIDIQSVNLELGGFNDYYIRSINYGVMHIFFNIFSFIIQDQFKFNYDLNFNSKPKLNFECIIKSNLGKIIVGLLKGKNKSIIKKEKRTNAWTSN